MTTTVARLHIFGILNWLTNENLKVIYNTFKKLNLLSDDVLE